MKRFSPQPEVPPDPSGRYKGLREQLGLNQAQLPGRPDITASTGAHLETYRIPLHPYRSFGGGHAWSAVISVLDQYGERAFEVGTHG